MGRGGENVGGSRLVIKVEWVGNNAITSKLGGISEYATNSVVGLGLLVRYVWNTYLKWLIDLDSWAFYFYVK